MKIKRRSSQMPPNYSGTNIYREVDVVDIETRTTDFTQDVSLDEVEPSFEDYIERFRQELEYFPGNNKNSKVFNSNNTEMDKLGFVFTLSRKINNNYGK